MKIKKFVCQSCRQLNPNIGMLEPVCASSVGASAQAPPKNLLGSYSEDTSLQLILSTASLPVLDLFAHGISGS